jgi:hypothetical protein
MDTTSIMAPMSVTRQSLTRRGMLAAAAGLAGLAVSETAAKSRQRGRKPLRGDRKRSNPEVAAAYLVSGPVGPGPGPGI